MNAPDTETSPAIDGAGGPRRRVLISSAWPPAVGGVASFVERLIRDSRFQSDFELIRHDNLKRPSTAFREERERALSRAGAPLRVLSSVRNYLSLLLCLVRRRPHVFQLHFNASFRGALFWEACAYLASARLLGTRVLVRHGGQEHFDDLRMGPVSRWLVRNVYARAAHTIILQWPELALRYDRWLGPSRGATELLVLPNTVDADRFTANRRGELRDDGTIRLGCIGGPDTERKGAFVILDAVKALASRKPDLASRLHLEVLAESAPFEAAAAAAGLTAMVRRHGYLGGEALVRWFQGLDVFLLPSYSEGFPNSLLEAMASGLPVVTTPVDAIPSVVEKGDFALMVEPGNVEGLAEAIATLAGDAESRTRRGREARRVVDEHYAVRGPWIEPLLAQYEKSTTTERRGPGETGATT